MRLVIVSQDPFDGGDLNGPETLPNQGEAHLVESFGRLANRCVEVEKGTRIDLI